MTMPSPLPRKFLATLEEARDAMRLLGQKAKQVRQELTSLTSISSEAIVLLQEMEALAYRTAFEIAQLDVAGACDVCPSAPPTTHSQAILIALADELDQRAEYLREVVGKERCWNGKRSRN